MEWGAEFLLIFLKLGKCKAIAESARILASYYGHYKPWKESKEEFHMAPKHLRPFETLCSGNAAEKCGPHGPVPVDRGL